MKQHPSVVIVLSGTKVPRGGLTSSALNRASQLAARGYNVHLCTFDYRPDFADHILDLRKQELIGNNVRVHNFYEHLRLKRQSSSPVDRVQFLNDLPYIKQKESSRLTRFFSPAGQLMYSELHGAGQSLWRRFYTANRVEKRRVEYSIKGTLHRETLFVENSSLVSCISYLDCSGRAFFTQWMDEEGKTADVFVADAPESSKRYASLHKAQESWFHSLSSIIGGQLVIMIDDCTMSPTVQNLRLENARIIAIFHNDHNTSAHKPMIDAMEAWDAVVCSTQGQASVLEDVVPQSLGVTVIPQPIPERSVTSERRNMATGRFAFFGRLARIKNVLPLVSSFVRVVESMPEASLDIYGGGPLEDELKELIVKLNLQKSVRLMGRTDDAVACMAEYSAVIVPSAFEAFGLVIGEAMLAKTPVIAFDCDFGPRDIITHGVNGILVEAGDFESLSDQMVYVSRNPRKATAMGIAGRRSILDRLSNDRVMTQWEQLIDGLVGSAGPGAEL